MVHNFPTQFCKSKYIISIIWKMFPAQQKYILRITLVQLILENALYI